MLIKMLTNQRCTFYVGIIVLMTCLGQIGCPPVDPKKPNGQPDQNNAEMNELQEMGIEYNRYLKEVVQILESDPEFRKKLESSDPEDIRTGKIAKELEYVNHHVRGKLDELKRQELERLRHAAIRQYEEARGLGIPHHKQKLKIPGHLDHKNPTFETEDLRKLIIQTTKDLEEADRKRKEEFKAYELQKEFEHREKLKNMDEEKRKDEERAWKEAQEKHKQHPKLHHPGSRQQLEEVWQEQDHLDPQNFNPKTFFSLHDLDGNGFWDQDEVKALFAKELDKVYDPNAPEDDMAERYEEMERMREHVFNETDVNRDYLISFEEFLDQTRKQEFERDQGWQTLDEQQPVYSEQEYMEFERQRQLEIQRLIDQGLLPPHPGMPYPHPNNIPMHGVPPPIQGGQYIPPPPPPQQINKMTPEEAARYQQPAYGQHQYAPQQPYGQPMQYGQPQYVPPVQYAGQQQQYVPQQVQYGQPQYVPQQGQPQYISQQGQQGQMQQGNANIPQQVQQPAQQPSNNQPVQQQPANSQVNPSQLGNSLPTASQQVPVANVQPQAAKPLPQNPSA